MLMNKNLIIRVNYIKENSTLRNVLKIINIILFFISIYLLIRLIFKQEVHETFYYSLSFSILLVLLFGYLTILSIVSFVFVYYYEKKDYLLSNKLLRLLMLLKLNIHTRKQISFSDRTLEIIKEVQKISKDNKNIVTTGGVASLIELNIDREINDIDLCSKSSLIPKINIFGEQFSEKDIFIRKEIKNEEYQMMLFKFIPSKYLKHKNGLIIPNSYFQLASKLLQLLKILNIDNFSNLKIERIIFDLKHFSLNNWDITVEEFISIYKDVILMSSLFSLVLPIDELLKLNTNLNLDNINKFENEKIFFNFFDHKIELSNLIKLIENDKKIINLRKSFSNNYEQVVLEAISEQSQFDFHNPLLSFENAESKNHFIKKYNIITNELISSYNFKETENTIDRRRIFLSLIANKYEELENGGSNG
ncbi:hypothetical protein [Mycoplasma sp. OR1901]|uniref:hypothetical protein n=1 Tax=Mycoplasma sp. OR1901 TaxID=2742195 RepID=UPI00158168AA|nr:hypothetical protein [Mycoplasma sp. OR1901]QKT05564.1 hypothetical protein HTZ87_02510 [Mycoplasma sp. OR1901]